METNSSSLAKPLAGKTALVTGAAVGIGLAVALKLAEAGAFIGLHYRSSEAEAHEALAAIRAGGGDGALLHGDLTVEEQANATVDGFITAAGRLDILINNAGALVARASIEDCSLELWNQTLDVNLTSAFLVTRRAIPHLRETGSGRIVNILSLSIQSGGTNGAGAYAIGKGGLQVFTRTLARELAPAVRTNAVMPGVIETRHHELGGTTPEQLENYRSATPLRRNGQADEVADAVLYLAGDGSSFVNGALLDISGGRFLR